MVPGIQQGRVCSGIDSKWASGRRQMKLIKAECG